MVYRGCCPEIVFFFLASSGVYTKFFFFNDAMITSTGIEICT